VNANSLSLSKISQQPKFSIDDICTNATRKIIKYIYFANNLHFKSNQNFLPYEMLDVAVKKSRRLSEVQHMRKLVQNFDDMLLKVSMSSFKWFSEFMKNRLNSPEDQISSNDLIFGIRKLCKQVGKEVWCEEDLQIFLQLVDPRSFGSLNILELTKTLDSCNRVFDEFSPPKMDVAVFEGGLLLFRHHRRIARLYGVIDSHNQLSIPLDIFASELELFFERRHKEDSVLDFDIGDDTENPVLSAGRAIGTVDSTQDSTNRGRKSRAASNSSTESVIYLPNIGETDPRNKILRERLRRQNENAISNPTHALDGKRAESRNGKRDKNYARVVFQSPVKGK